MLVHRAILPHGILIDEISARLYKEAMQITDINGSTRNPKKVFLDPQFPGYVRVEFNRYHEWYSIKEFLQFNPDLKHIVEGAPEPPPEMTAIVGKADSLTLKDATQNWKPNSYLGYMVWISRGKGEGQKRTVVKNTKNTLTIDKAWEVKPNTTSQYVLAQHITDVPAMGNTLPQEDMKKLEEAAIKMDLLRGQKPHERQYTLTTDKEAESK